MEMEEMIVEEEEEEGEINETMVRLLAYFIWPPVH
jgi:hypothetical protein